MFCTYCGATMDAQARFCPNCGQSPGAAAPPAPANPSPGWTLPSGVQSQTGKWLGEGWEVVKADLGNAILLTLLVGVLGIVPFIGPALMAGFQFYYLRKLSGRRAEIGDVFKGFNFFVPTLLAGLVTGIFVFGGTLLCVIPGLVVAAMYKFAYLFIMDKRMEFWPAMQASHAVVKQDYFGFTMFLIVCALLNIVGMLCCVVGVFITVPMTMAAIVAAYRDTVGFDPQNADRA